jgi:hypothetical protein
MNFYKLFFMTARAKVEILNALADRLELETVKAAKKKKIILKIYYKMDFLDYIFIKLTVIYLYLVNCFISFLYLHTITIGRVQIIIR